MEIHRHKGLVYYSFEILSPYPHLKHGVFTRKAPAKLGGDLTFAFRPNLPVARVLTSLSLAQKALGLGPPAMVKQTHGTAIYLHDHNAPAYQPQSPDELLVGYDALVSEPKSSLLIKLADCQGILLFHPPSKVLALVHSGWRGTTANIIGRTVTFLAERLLVPPAELIAAVSPSLGPCCFEFKDYQSLLPMEFWIYRDSRNRFDFWAIALDQLTAAGLDPKNVQIAEICSKCQPDFYSHRRGDQDRFAFFAGVD